MSPSVSYQERPWPQLRNMVNYILGQHRPYTVYGFVEVDITDTLAKLRSCQKKSRVALSLHTCILYCLSRTAAEHELLRTYRYGRRLITFDDVDIATAIERRMLSGERMPVGYIVRQADQKSLAEIVWELRQATKSNLDDDGLLRMKMRKRISSAPAFLRKMFGRWLQYNPIALKKMHGSLGLTSLQYPEYTNRPYFGFPPNIYTWTLAVGNIVDRIMLQEDGTPHVRKMLCLASGVDHQIMDGIEISRIAYTWTKIIESGTGLDEAFVQEVATKFSKKKRYSDL